MRISPSAHLTYCTNIHPGESWAEVRRNLETHVIVVKERVSPGAPFGVGLRLGAAAARELLAPCERARLREWLDRNHLYVFTINGFPYGPFHGEPVKERVYRPDWQEDERLRYSDDLADLLADLLPSDLMIEGSVSTVPGCYRARSTRSATSAMAERLIRHAAHLVALRERTGQVIALALEPEPCCFLETIAETAAFFEHHLFSRAAQAFLGRLTGLAAGPAEEALRRHLGVCLDACHAAVEFEEPARAIAALRGAGIRIPKIQLSAGMRIPRLDARSLRALEPYAEGVYLHQVVARSPGGVLTRYLDLPEALAAARPQPGEEWRIHFHVPIFRADLGPFESTQPFLAELCAMQAQSALSAHLEVETYTWGVLPGELRGEPVVDSIVRELRWAAERVQSKEPLS
jgi:sugar phosphate isomerase/epimerase